MAVRLLVVDDEEMNRDLLSRRLLRSGYEVVSAAGGPEALEILESQQVDLVLLDVMMPGMSGMEVLERIRLTRPASEFPVIMVTALPEREGIVEALRTGANDYIVKPVDYAIALARIETRLALADANQRQRESVEMYRLASSASDEGLWDWDMANRKLFCSPRWKSILGFSDAEIGCQVEEWFERIHPDDQLRWKAALEQHLKDATAGLECEYRMRHKDGRYRWVECRGGASRDASGAAVRLAGHMTDITARKTLDAATLLPNRVWLEGELEDAAEPSAAAALILLELEGFDRHRENLSDKGAGILRAVAGRLHAVLRALSAAGEVELVCSGEQQFAVLVRNPRDPADLENWGQRMQNALEEPFEPPGANAVLSASAGIAVAAAGEPRDRLLRDAQAALRHARESGKNQTAVFHQELRRHELLELRLEADLRRAVERREFVVYYQPKVDLQDYSIVGFEALVRWQRPDFGLVMPNDFIPLAESNGMIVPIGLFVLEQACRDTAALRRVFPDAEVSVNVSGRQFSDPRLAEMVAKVLEATMLESEALRLEVTETVVMIDAARALATMRQLREMGVGLKLDDFGAGYSSLAYLQQFPFDTVKIDRAFVLGMENAEGLAIVRTIIELARSLQLSLVAEGIESRRHAETLRTMGCRYGQGYWFSKAVELARLRELLAGWKLPPASAARVRGEAQQVSA